MNDDDIRTYAEQAANELPARAPEAERMRRAFGVVEVWREGPNYLAVRVRVDSEFENSFIRPGQYVTFQYGELDPRFLVIANAPSDERGWEFLIDADSDLGEIVEAIEVGAEVVLSPAEGSGFPATDLADRPILMFATGSGIASMRPVIQHWAGRDEQAPEGMALYYGEASDAHFAYVREFPDWRRDGVRLFRAIEDIPHPEDGYQYVQHAFEDDDPDLKHAFVFVSGAPVMMEMIIAKLIGLGVDPERIFTNI